MIKQIDTYTVICDNCGKDVCDGAEFSGWNDEDYVADVAKEEGWIEDENDGKHYCPACYQYDDDDNLIINVSLP